VGNSAVPHSGRQNRAEQLKRVARDPEIIEDRTDMSERWRIVLGSDDAGLGYKDALQTDLEADPRR
jgi:hypothetical protein